MLFRSNEKGEVVQISIKDAFDTLQKQGRENRIIIGGNLLRARGLLRNAGTLISYTDNIGNLRQGFLMPPNFDLTKLVSDTQRTVRNPNQALEFLKRGGTIIDRLTSGRTVKIENYAGRGVIINVSAGGTGKKISKNSGVDFTSVGRNMRAYLDYETSTPRLIKLLSDIINPSIFDTDLVLEPGSNTDKILKQIADDTQSQRQVPLQSITPITPVVNDTTRPQTKRRIRFLNEQRKERKISNDQFIDEVDAALARDQQAKVQQTKDRTRGADYLKERLYNARRNGYLTQEAVDMAVWFIDKNPALVDDLGISIKTPEQAGVAGEYEAITRLVYLFKNAAKDNTVVHEILHHLERMMPPDMQAALRKEWMRSLLQAKTEAGSEKEAEFFDLLDQYHFGDPMASYDALLTAAVNMIKTGQVPFDYYQFVNPSEFWAVNATRIMEGRYRATGSTLKKISNWLKELGQTIKKVFGFKSDATIIKALDSLMKGDGRFQSSMQLSDGRQLSLEDMVQKADQFLQKRKPPPSVNFEGVSQDFLDTAKPIFFPQRETIVDRLNAMRNDFWMKLAQGLADNYRRIRFYSEESYMLARMSRATDGALEGLLFNGQVFLDSKALNIRPNTKGMIEIMKPLGKEVDRYMMWVALNREANLPSDKRSNIAGLDELVDRREELSDGELNGQSRLEVYNRVREQMNALNKSVLDVALQTGLINSTAQAINEIRNRPDMTEDAKAAAILYLQENPIGYEKFANDIWYIPFYREMENGDISAINSASRLTSQNFSKVLEGSVSPFADLMENVLRNWSHILSASMKNQAAKSTMDAAMNYGNNAVIPNLRPQYYMEGGQVYNRANDEIVGDGSLKPWMTSNDSGTNAKVIVDGSPMYFRVLDPMLLESISQIGYQGPQSKFVSVARDFKNLLQFGVTVSPPYKVRNLFRDSIQSMAVSGLKRDPFRNVVDGWMSSDKDHPSFISALAGGAVMNFGSYNEGDQALMVKRLIKKGVDANTIITDPARIPAMLRRVWDKYQEWGNKSESANRMALYNQLRAEGKSHLEASFHARDLMDFSMHGSWNAWRTITQVTPFLNSRVQGLYKLGRDGILPTVRVFYNTITGQEITDQSDKQKAAAFTTVTGAVMLATIMLYLAFKDDEDFRKRDDWDRDNFWWIKIPGMDSAIRLPKPFEIGAMATLAERTLEQIIDQGSEGREFQNSLTRMMVDTFALNLPQIIKPMVDLYANKDSFTGAPIESAGMERLSKAERATDNTSPLAIALGGVANAVLPTKLEVSPVQIDYSIKAYFGWLGGTAAWMSKFAVMPFQEGTKPDERWLDTASIGFIRSLPATQSRYVNNFYETNRELSQALADMRHYAAVGDERKVTEILTEKGDKIALAKMYDNAARDMSRMRQYIRIVTNDSTLSGEAKRQEIDRIKILISDIAKLMEDTRKDLKEK